MRVRSSLGGDPRHNGRKMRYGKESSQKEDKLRDITKGCYCVVDSRGESLLGTSGRWTRTCSTFPIPTVRELELLFSCSLPSVVENCSLAVINSLIH